MTNKIFTPFFVLLAVGPFLTGQAMAKDSTGSPAPGHTKQLAPDQWYRQGQQKAAALSQTNPFPPTGKNIILFIGDGMNITTITAARILAGQQKGGFGEENTLSFERLPQTALAKTYNTNQQTPDSAGTMSAIMTGIKTKAGVIAMDGQVLLGDCDSGKGHEVPTLLERAETAGMHTGVVTTARLTHATPAATYAHSVMRDWEVDSKIPKSERAKGCRDIASQLIDFPFGDGLEVALGGGRQNFLPNRVKDPEYPAKSGLRLDGRDLMYEWEARYPHARAVWNQQQFAAIDPKKTDHLLGLFEPGHMRFEHDRPQDKAGEPALHEMTAKALDILQAGNKPFFLMVEAGRIDHAHHKGNAFHALTDTIELEKAVQTALDKVDLNNTLIIVTADHSHTFNMAGYPKRGNPILGTVVRNDKQGQPSHQLMRDLQGKAYTTLGYQNGPGYVNGNQRPDLAHVDTQAHDYKQAAAIPMFSETHSGEDVAVFATGAGSQPVHGVFEQNVLFHLMQNSNPLIKAIDTNLELLEGQRSLPALRDLDKLVKSRQRAPKPPSMP